MNQTDFKTAFEKASEKFLKVGLDPQEAKQLVDVVLQQPWVKELMVFSGQALILVDTKTGNYLYVSPSVESLIGYKPEEFTGIPSLSKIADSNELVIITKLIELAFTKYFSFNFSTDEQQRIRFSRNNWFIKKDGTRVNVLQQSKIIAFNEQGLPLLEFMLLTDITHFNTSSHHFYSISKIEDDGTSEVLFHGVLEEELISPREREIYSWLTRGKTSEEIAALLGISSETVKSHRKSLLQKTGNENSIDLLRYGFAQGWI